jgi:hypothetical protein
MRRWSAKESAEQSSLLVTDTASGNGNITQHLLNVFAAADPIGLVAGRTGDPSTHASLAVVAP